MKKVIIINYTAKREGIILETNIPARLIPNRMPSKETFVSWDKIGKLLFEDYTELDGVASRDSIRNNSSLKEEVEKQYCMPDNINTKEEHEQYLIDCGAIKKYTTRLLKYDKFQVIDQHENNNFQGTEIECLQWIDLKGRDSVS
jgi:hypothetical protein